MNVKKNKCDEKNEIELLQSFYNDFNCLYINKQNVFMSFLVSVFLFVIPLCFLVMFFFKQFDKESVIFQKIPIWAIFVLFLISLPFFFVSISITLKIHQKIDKDEKGLMAKYPDFKKYKFSKPNEIFKQIKLKKKAEPRP